MNLVYYCFPTAQISISTLTLAQAHKKHSNIKSDVKKWYKWLRPSGFNFLHMSQQKLWFTHVSNNGLWPTTSNYNISTQERGELVDSNIALLNKMVVNLVDRLEKLKTSWPEGSYCILGSGGSCPEGFTRHQGHSKAIWTYMNANGYTKEATFGDSKIGTHVGRGPTHARNDWNVDIILTSCCK